MTPWATRTSLGAATVWAVASAATPKGAATSWVAVTNSGRHQTISSGTNAHLGERNPKRNPVSTQRNSRFADRKNQREVCRTQHVAASARHTSCFMSRPRHRSFGMQVRRRRRRLRRHEYCMWVLWGTRRRNRNDIYRRGWGGCHLAAWSAGAGSGVPPARPGPACTQPRRKRAATQYCPMLTIFNMRTPCLGRIWVGIGRTCTT